MPFSLKLSRLLQVYVFSWNYITLFTGIKITHLKITSYFSVFNLYNIGVACTLIITNKNECLKIITFIATSMSKLYRQNNDLFLKDSNLCLAFINTKQYGIAILRRKININKECLVPCLTL